METTYIGAKPNGNLWALVTTKDGQLYEYRASKGTIRNAATHTRIVLFKWLGDIFLFRLDTKHKRHE